MINTIPIKNYNENKINNDLDTDNGLTADSKHNSLNSVAGRQHIEQQTNLNQVNPVNNTNDINHVQEISKINDMARDGNPMNNTNHVNYVNNINNVRLNNGVGNLQNNGSLFAKFDEEKNAYVIYFGSNIDCIITNHDILKAIITPNNNDQNVRKYVFVISLNHAMNVEEFNFVNSVFTNNAQIMIQLQNFIYDTLNHLSTTNQDEILEIITIFYYQMIIFMFKNYENYTNYENINKFFSTLTYRFSSLVLKQTLNVQKDSDNIKMNCEKILNIKQKLLSKMELLDNHVRYLNQNNSMVGGNVSDSSSSSTTSSRSS